MDGNVRVIDRVFDIIEQLAQSASPLGLTEITQKTGMSKSTVHRLLSSMISRHYVEKNPDNTYRIGHKMIETVSYHINGLELLTESKPYLYTIRQELNLTSHLGVLDGGEVIYVEKMDTYPNTRLYTQVGYRSPAYCSSIGKCLLSCLSRDELDEVLYTHSLKRHTENTICNENELRKHLSLVRSQGWAMDNEEYLMGHRCIGAPVFDYRGDCVAAISASGSTTYLHEGIFEDVIRHVKEAAADLSQRMGYIK